MKINNEGNQNASGSVKSILDCLAEKVRNSWSPDLQKPVRFSLSTSQLSNYKEDVSSLWLMMLGIWTGCYQREFLFFLFINIVHAEYYW